MQPQPEIKPRSKFCWEKPPYECPARFDLLLSVSGSDEIAPRVVGHVEGDEGYARVVMGGAEFVAEGRSFQEAANKGLGMAAKTLEMISRS